MRRHSWPTTTWRLEETELLLSCGLEGVGLTF
jgi:hypothetical protein